MQGHRVAKIDKGYRQLFHDSVAPTAILDRDFNYVDVSSIYERVLGQSREVLIGQCVFDAFPDTVEKEISLRRAWTEALAGQISTIDKLHYPIPAAEGDGMEDRWWAVHSGPVQFGDDLSSLLVFRVEDITERVRVEQAREMVTRELQHRMLNLTTLIGVIARQSALLHEACLGFTSRLQQHSWTACPSLPRPATAP